MTQWDVYRFGPFTLEIGERRLSGGPTAIHLAPKAFDVLTVLVQHSGRLITKDELLARVWPEVFVEEGILTVHVSAVRKALGDQSGRPSYIETVPRSGYRFVAAVVHEMRANGAPPVEPIRPVELYEFMGRGRSHLLSGSHVELPLALDAFRAAIAVDPTYAPAHAGLARTRCTQAVLRAVPHQEAFAEAKASALRALALDSGSVDAHVALGTVQFLVDWDWFAAEHTLQRALHASPDLTEALIQLGSLYEALGWLDEGLRLKQRVLARDPHSPLVLVHIAFSCAHQRRYDEALAWAHRALEIAPGQLLAGIFIAFVLWLIGDIDGFIAHARRTAATRGFSTEALASLETLTGRMEQVHATDGFTGWSAFLAEQLATASSVDARSTSASQRAMLYGAAGLVDDAFRCLDEAIAVRDPAMVYLAVGPQWDWLRNDPRFAKRLRAVFPDAPPSSPTRQSA